MIVSYVVTYTDHRHDRQEVRCSSFEDAERIAEWLVGYYVSHSDGTFSWEFDREGQKAEHRG